MYVNGPTVSVTLSLSVSLAVELVCLLFENMYFDIFKDLNGTFICVWISILQLRQWDRNDGLNRVVLIWFKLFKLKFKHFKEGGSCILLIDWDAMIHTHYLLLWLLRTVCKVCRLCYCIVVSQCQMNTGITVVGCYGMGGAFSKKETSAINDCFKINFTGFSLTFFQMLAGKSVCFTPLLFHSKWNFKTLLFI